MVNSKILLLAFNIIFMVYCDEKLPKSHFDKPEIDDMEALTGKRSSSDPNDLSPGEAKTRLSKLFDKMDKSGDGLISMEELVEWILQSFESLDNEDAKERLEEYDDDKDGKINFTEFLKHVYNYTPEEYAKAMAQGEQKDEDGMYSILKEDKERFETADLDKDGVLNFEEYRAFLHPYNYPHLAPLEAAKVAQEYDKDKDGRVSRTEFLQFVENMEADIKQEEEERFRQYDTDHDGFLSGAEIEAWANPPLRTSAENEAEHLLETTDTDKDRMLSKEEILASHETWVASSATNYGGLLHDEL